MYCNNQRHYYPPIFSWILAYNAWPRGVRGDILVVDACVFMFLGEHVKSFAPSIQHTYTHINTADKATQQQQHKCTLPNKATKLRRSKMPVTLTSEFTMMMMLLLVCRCNIVVGRFVVHYATYICLVKIIDTRPEAWQDKSGKLIIMRMIIIAFAGVCWQLCCLLLLWCFFGKQWQWRPKIFSTFVVLFMLLLLFLQTPHGVEVVECVNVVIVVVVVIISQTEVGNKIKRKGCKKRNEMKSLLNILLRLCWLYI